MRFTENKKKLTKKQAERREGEGLMSTPPGLAP